MEAWSQIKALDLAKYLNIIEPEKEENFFFRLLFSCKRSKLSSELSKERN